MGRCCCLEDHPKDRHRDHPCAVGSRHRDVPHRDHRDRLDHPCAAQSHQDAHHRVHPDLRDEEKNHPDEGHLCQPDHPCAARSWHHWNDQRDRLPLVGHCQEAGESDDRTPMSGDRYLAAAESDDPWWMWGERAAPLPDAAAAAAAVMTEPVPVPVPKLPE